MTIRRRAARPTTLLVSLAMFAAPLGLAAGLFAGLAASAQAGPLAGPPPAEHLAQPPTEHETGHETEHQTDEAELPAQPADKPASCVKHKACGEKCDPPKQPHRITLGDGQIRLAAPAEWSARKPATNIVEFEFAIPAAAGDATEGRLTVMGAGGTVEANIERWYAQFARQTRNDRQQLAIAGHEVHVVDVSGSYRDSRGPFAPVEVRDNYRMIAAIIVTDKLGKYFFKLYGPEKTIADNHDAFRAMLETLSVGE